VLQSVKPYIIYQYNCISKLTWHRNAGRPVIFLGKWVGRGLPGEIAIAGEGVIIFCGTSPLHFFTVRGWQDQNYGTFPGVRISDFS
jgi:hypothetical protein